RTPFLRRTVGRRDGRSVEGLAAHGNPRLELCPRVASVGTEQEAAMNERWEKLQRLYHAARELDGEPQSRFLDEACRSDSEMRQQIDVLLQQDREHSSFLNTPAVDLAALLRPMLEIGSRLSRYRIDALLGAGGMGVVYRAYDPTLERPLAIKVLQSAAQ